VKTELAMMTYARGIEMIIPKCEGLRPDSYFEAYSKKNPKILLDNVDHQLNLTENKFGMGLKDRFTGHEEAQEVEEKLNAVV
jgi:hypothetical protein